MDMRMTTQAAPSGTARRWRRPLWFLFLLSFVEGGAVMAVELVGARMVGPFYGNSLYVWAAVLALTLAGLMAGYFVGGLLSRRYPQRRTLHLVVLASAALVALMPLTAEAVMEASLGLGLRTGITLSCLLFLFPPLACFGMVSPLIIRLVASDDDRVGHAAGMVYAVSTVGGILATYLVAFHALPDVGMQESLFVTAACLALFPVLHFTGVERRLAG